MFLPVDWSLLDRGTTLDGHYTGNGSFLGSLCATAGLQRLK